MYLWTVALDYLIRLYLVFCKMKKMSRICCCKAEFSSISGMMKLQNGGDKIEHLNIESKLVIIIVMDSKGRGNQ